MGVLTAERAKPALPYAGSYQLIDFPLSNLHHSGIGEVWLCLQYQGETIHDLVANGRPWDLDRTSGGLRLVFPQQSGDRDHEQGFATGNADQLFRIRERLAASSADVVLVMSADHVYALDFNEVLETHRRAEAECTVVTTTCSLTEAAAHAVVRARRDGTVTHFDYKPDTARSRVIAAEVFAYDRKVLLQGLDELVEALAPEAERGDTGLGDFGEHLLPWFVARGRTVVHRLPGYWMDLGRPETYLQAHRDLIEGRVSVFSPQRPILTQQPQRVPARVAAGARVEDSLLSGGVEVSGTVRRSVLGPGVIVEAGAVVADSVIFADTVIRAGATVRWSILDEKVTVGARAQVGGSPRTRPVPSESITVLGAAVRVAQGSRVSLGEQVPPRARR